MRIEKGRRGYLLRVWERKRKKTMEGKPWEEDVTG